MTAFCLLLVTPASAQVTSYVAPGGNDLNPGSITQPYLTIQHCAVTVPSGSTCMVRAGTYYETVTPNSGVTIQSYSGETVTLDGTDAVTGWALYQGAIYRAHATLASDDTNQLFAGGKMMTEARWPNGDDPYHVNWATLAAGTTTAQLVDPKLPPINWTGAKIHFLSGPDPYAPQSGTVTSSAPGQLTFNLDGGVYLPDILPTAGGFYYLYRLLAALDAPDEWYYDPAAQQLYFWAPGDVDPNTLAVRAKRRQYCFDLSSRSNVSIRNIDLFGCTINMNQSSSGNIIDGIRAQYLSQYTDLPVQNPIYPTDYWYTHNQDSGIVLNGSGNTLINSTITWSAGNGVTVMGSNQTVKNNLVANTGYIGNDATGISVFGTGHSIQYNTVHTSGRYAVTIYSYPVNPNNNDVSYNNLYDAMKLGPDGGEFYTGEAVVTGTQIHHNWLHDTEPLPGVLAAIDPNITRNGANLDAGSEGFEVDQNVLWNNSNNSVVLNGVPEGATNLTPNNNLVHNNTVVDLNTRSYILLMNIGNCGTTTVSNNLVLVSPTVQQYNAACPATGNGPNAPGATEMTGPVQVGCNFAGCSSPGPPAISGKSVAASVAVPPLSVTVPAGQTATFNVAASGSPVIQYQWQKNGNNIGNAFGASYTTPPAALGDDGTSFTVAVSNAIGGEVSRAAILSVIVNQCDLQQNGSVTVTDLQSVLRQALGTEGEVNDLNHDGAVNVSDVEIELNAVQGAGCSAR